MEFDMGRLLTLIGLLVTVLYVGLVFFLTSSRVGDLQVMPLNEVGDFLAGAFGPLAILWLILGFFQQGIELRLNNEALKLQAEELKNSVEQQRVMAAAALKQLDNQTRELEESRARENTAYKANFAIEARHKMTSGEGAQSMLKITNLGGDALHVNIIATPTGVFDNLSYSLIRRDEVMEFVALVAPQPEKVSCQLIVLYEDVRRIGYQVIYYFDIEKGRFSKFVEAAHSKGSPA